jgi:hypothetical protein
LIAAETLVLIVLGIAGWRIRLEVQTAGAEDAVVARYAPFLVPEVGSFDGSMTVVVDADMPPGEDWPERLATRQGSLCKLDTPQACGIIDLDSLETAVRVSRRGFFSGLEFCLQATCAYLAFRNGGLLFHCAGVLSGRAAYLFTGEGGSGKSTVVSLLDDRLALNDDLVMLRPNGRDWQAFGTPFWNKQTSRRTGQTADGIVAGIYRLTQDQRVYLEPLSEAVALAELMANCPIVNTDPVALPTLLRRCRALAEAVEVQRLHFRKSASFWPLLHTRDTE